MLSSRSSYVTTANPIMYGIPNLDSIVDDKTRIITKSNKKDTRSNREASDCREKNEEESESLETRLTLGYLPVDGLTGGISLDGV